MKDIIMDTINMKHQSGRHKNSSTVHLTDAQLSIEVIKDLNTFDSISRQWNDLVEETDSHIFQTFEWQRIWWKYFGENSESHFLHIILFRQNDHLIGIAPFFVDLYKYFGKPLYRCLRLIGSKIMQDADKMSTGWLTHSDYLDLIIKPGYEDVVYQGLRDYFLQYEVLDDIIMEEIDGRSSLLSNFVVLLNEINDFWKVEIENSSVCPIVELNGDWDQFLKGLSSNMRYQVRRFIKRASDGNKKKIFDIYQFDKEEEIGPAYEKLVHFHQNRWNDRGRPGAFNEQRMYQFYKEITSTFHKKGWLQFQKVTVPEQKNQCVAIDLMFRYNKTVYLIHRGFDDSSSYAEYGPGNSLLYTVIKEAADDGFKCYDFLRGDESYKFRVATNAIQNKNIIIRKVQKSTVSLLLFYHFIYRMIFLKRRIRFEWSIIANYFKSKRPVNALRSYTNDLSSRIALKFK